MVKVVAGVAIRENKVFIARRSAHKSLPGLWEFPGGKVDVGETHNEALAREFLEEFSIVVKIFKEIYKYQDLQEQMELIAILIEFESEPLKSTDHDDFRWVNTKDLDKYEFCPMDKPITVLIQIDYSK